MTDCLFAENIREFVIELFHAYGIEEWKTLTPIELGILSWHLGNFYCCPYISSRPERRANVDLFEM